MIIKHETRLNYLLLENYEALEARNDETETVKMKEWEKVRELMKFTNEHAKQVKFEIKNDK